MSVEQTIVNGTLELIAQSFASVLKRMDQGMTIEQAMARVVISLRNQIKEKP